MSVKKYKQGKRIDYMAELGAALEADGVVYVLCNRYAVGTGKPINTAFLENIPLKTVLNFVNQGRIFKAEKRRKT